MRRIFWMRRILAIVLGTAAALAIITGMEAIAQRLYPSPDSFDTLDRVELATQMAAIPLPAKLIVVFGWFAGAFGGAWLARRIGDGAWVGWIVAALVLAGCIANFIALPHPVWMQFAGIAAPLAGGWLGLRLHSKPYKGEPLLG